MALKKYLIEIDSINPMARKGTYVYECTRYDYGAAKTDTALLNRHCVTVTYNEDGDYPFLVLPMDILSEVLNEDSKS